MDIWQIIVLVVLAALVVQPPDGAGGARGRHVRLRVHARHAARGEIVGVEAVEMAKDLRPDVVLIDLANPSRDILEELALASGPMERPVAMFVDRSDVPMMQAAMDAGISAYVVDGLQPQRIRSILDVAILRFNAFARLQRELSEARGELADRKLIERAKGILMTAKGLSEEEAYRTMRRKAMNEKRKIADIARAIVTAADLLG